MTRSNAIFGLACGELPPGRTNGITELPVVIVGRATVRSGDINTGVTAILPYRGNLFRRKVVSASHVINGFVKTTGLVQVNELGTIETPILLTKYTLGRGMQRSSDPQCRDPQSRHRAHDLDGQPNRWPNATTAPI